MLPDGIDENQHRGGYYLLNHLVDSHFVKHIDNIQVQLDDFVPNAEERMVKIQKNVKRTYFTTYQHLFAWEDRRRKELI